MLEHRVQLRVCEWDDVAFRSAVEDAWTKVRLGPDDADSIMAAAHLQMLVRAAGFPETTVEVHRSVDEALAHVAHFEVHREPSKTLVGA
jgi:hypothetical protein